MLLKVRIGFIVCLLFITGITQAQEYEFKYQRKLDGVNDSWHRLIIPKEAYSTLNNDFSDVRILGIKEDGDTIEAPYILKTLSDTYDNQVVEFKLLNKVNNSAGYYYTFELSETKFINHVNLEFNRTNFDWLVTLEGSQNQEEWFTISDNHRILSINNSHTSYSYTNLEFDQVKFKYLRLSIPSFKNPGFIKAVIEQKKLVKGEYIVPLITSHLVVENEKNDQTEILIDFDKVSPLSYLELNVFDSIDYYRAITVQYAMDSIKNNTGWHYLYRSLFSSTLSSLNQRGFNFHNRTMKHLKVIIKNGDNEPLTFGQSNLHGNPHELIVRFTEPANYYFTYGNTGAYVPNYDISRFENNIPVVRKNLIVGNEEIVERQEKGAKQEPLFKDSIWLWAIMIIAIFILGWFSLKMLKNN